MSCWYENKTLSKHSFFIFGDKCPPLRRSWSAALRSVKTPTDIEALQVGTRLKLVFNLLKAPSSPPSPPKTL